MAAILVPAGLALLGFMIMPAPAAVGGRCLIRPRHCIICRAVTVVLKLQDADVLWFPLLVGFTMSFVLRLLAAVSLGAGELLQLAGESGDQLV